jgi:hypothetical protein
MIHTNIQPRFTIRIQDDSDKLLEVGWYVFTVNAHGYADYFIKQPDYASAYATAFIEHRCFGYVRVAGGNTVEMPK